MVQRSDAAARPGWQGELLGGRYLLGPGLGHGGMGTVYQATDLRTGGTVAVKFLHPALAANQAHRERLRREAEIAATVTSPRVVRVFDVGEHDDLPYLVMEYVQGETLAERMRRTGPLPVAVAVDVALEIARALEAAHALGIVHRDLKPQNVMLADGLVKVLDFGIAHAEGMAGLTLAGAFVGTPEYAAPERAAGHADARSDIYSLGVVLYVLLEGRPPPAPGGGPGADRWHGATPAATPSPAALPLPAAPPAVQEIVRRCLQPDPERRFQSATALAAALAAILGTEVSAGPSDGRAPTDVATPAPGTTPAPALAPPPLDLPAPLTTFVGRERERVEVCRLLGTARLLTLTGAGGSGKTRLALQVAVESRGAFPDGVWLVELAALSEPALVAPAVAAAVGMRESPGRPLMETLARALGPRRLLLILDNCEHLAGACAGLAEALLRAGTQLRILATSREALGLTGETVWPVTPLEVPSAAASTLPARLIENPAVRLFVDRAKAVAPRFTLTEENGPAVAQVCRRLDGLPLALELAAARVRVLSVEQIAARLDDRFRLLTGGGRTAPARQQTLRATIDWSHSLLSAPERLLFRRLAVFAGGFDLDAAGTVCAGDDLDAADVLDLLTQLVDRSLVVAEPGTEPAAEQETDPGAASESGGEGGARFRLLETVREYVAERLREADEEAIFRSRHAAWCLDLAGSSEAEWNGPRQAAWLDRLETEHENLRQALRWCVAAGGAGQTEARALGLRLGGAIWRFWHTRGYFAEGSRWLEDLLALPAPAGDAPAGGAPAGDARAEAAQTALADVLNGAGALAHTQGDDAQARRLFQESLAIRRQHGDRRGIASSLNNLGVVARTLGEHTTAQALFEEALAINRAEGYRAWEAITLNNLGNVAQDRDEYDTARTLLEQALAIQQALGDTRGMAMSANDLGDAAVGAGDLEVAQARYRTAMTHQRRLGDRPAMIGSLIGLATVASRLGDADRGARLLGAADALRRTLGLALLPRDRRAYQANLAAVRTALGREAFAGPWSAGQAMTMDEAATYALGRD